MKTKMIKKFIALSLAVLVMASNMVPAYAALYETDNHTENGVTGKIYYTLGNPNYRTYWASTSADKRKGYISVSILIENAGNNAFISKNEAYGHNLDYADTYAYVNYGQAISVRVSSTHQAGSSKSNLTTDFGMYKVYIL